MHRHTFRPAVTALCALLLAACAENDRAEIAPAPSPGSPVRVTVQPLIVNAERTRVEAVGTSRARLSVVVHPAVSGEVVAVNFEPGQKVGRGYVLVELDRRTETLAVELAKVQLADAQRLYERYWQARDSGAVVPTALDAARTAMEAARIELDRARVALDYRTIRAPFAGYVGITDIDPGDRINTETQITTLDDRTSLLVSFEVPEMLNGRLQRNDKVQVTTWNSHEAANYGEIIEVDSRIDPATRTFVARARVDNGDDRLRPGMSFRVTVDVPGLPYPVVPEISLQWGAEGAFVWTVTGNQVRRVPVAIVQRKEGEILVDSAQLEAGDLIVVEGIQRVRDGGEVVYDRPSLADRTNDTAAGAPAVPL
ncbi:MAG: efflux RND transporter periplasmic adaptor subunit [Steroidobacteraceae bacterium]